MSRNAPAHALQFQLAVGVMQQIRRDNDVEFARDLKLVGDYLRVLRTAASTNRGHVSDSLRYAAWRKLMRLQGDTH